MDYMWVIQDLFPTGPFYIVERKRKVEEKEEQPQKVCNTGVST